jgi:hypothetical protein
MNAKRLLLFTILLLTTALAMAQQQYRISGKVTNNKLEPLAFASVQLTPSKFGTITKEDGSYSLLLDSGSYDIVISMVGYQTQNLHVLLTADTVQNIMMEEDGKKGLEDVVIKVKIKDRSEEIIRNVIRTKEDLAKASGAYSAHLYVRALQEVTGKKEKKDTGFNEPAGIDNLAMSEVAIKLDYESDNKVKEERTGIRNYGNTSSLFLPSVAKGNFSLYNNLINLPALSTTTFLSPISYSGLLAYKFKTVKIEKRNGIRVFIIQVKPRQLSNATVEGEVVVQDSTWAILHARYRLPKFHLPEYDFFEVTQDYEYVNNQAWMLSRQQFDYYTKGGKQKITGQTLVRYSNYELQKQFGPKHFGTEISATTFQAYQQNDSFWNAVRREPLTLREARYVNYQDSMWHVTHTEAYLDSAERANNRIDWKKISLFGQTIHHRKKERTWELPSLISLYDPLQFGGGRFRPSLYYYKRYPNRKDLMLHFEASYGFRNKDLNGSVGFHRLYNPFNRGYYAFTASRNFARIFSGDAWLNQLKRSNFFLNNYFSAVHGLEITNGLYVDAELNLALRRSVKDYDAGGGIDSLITGVLKDDKPLADFSPTNAVYSTLTLRYTPEQRYTREPAEKRILGSRWPTFYAKYRKGYPGLIGSDINFDYLEFGIEQEVKAGIMGTMRYRFKTGDFLNKKNLSILDYNYQRQGDPFLFMDPHEAFQALDSTFPLFNRFYQMHLVHEFNGAFLNKIPLFKKLQLREVAGGGFLIAPERNLRYAEIFAGVERVFKMPFDPTSKVKIGFYVVGSAANQFRNPIQFKLGLTTWNKRWKKWN